MPSKDRELVSPPPTLAGLQQLSGPAPDWLAKELGKAAGKSAEQLSQPAIQRHGGEPRDDIAVLVLNRN